MSEKKWLCSTSYMKHWTKKFKKMTVKKKAIYAGKTSKKMREKIKKKKKINDTEYKMMLDPEQILALKKLNDPNDNSKKQKLGASNLTVSKELKVSLDKMNIKERVKKIFWHLSEVFGPLPRPG